MTPSLPRANSSHRGPRSRVAPPPSPPTSPARALRSSVTGGERDEHRARILAVVDSIPRGRVATYGQVALEAGLARRARLVGKILSTLAPGTKLPWHRVVNSAGTISLRPGSGASTQRSRLRHEGIPVSPSGRLDLRRFRWQPEP